MVSRLRRKAPDRRCFFYTVSTCVGEAGLAEYPIGCIRVTVVQVRQLSGSRTYSQGWG